MIFAFTIAVFAPVTAHAVPETYIPAHGSKISDTQYAWVGGQKSDLTFQIDDANIQWRTQPCENTEENCYVLLGVSIPIIIQWSVAEGVQGGTDLSQVEGSDDVGESDFVTMFWRDKDRWEFAGLTNENGQNVLGIQTEVGTIDGEDWNGIKINDIPETTPAIGRNLSETYTLIFNYDPLLEDDCRVVDLPIKGFYTHTFIGDTHFNITPSASGTFSASIPWAWSGGLELGFELTGENNHFWQKSLILNDDQTIIRHITAPEKPLSRESCCEDPPSSGVSDDDSTSKVSFTHPLGVMSTNSTFAMSLSLVDYEMVDGVDITLFDGSSPIYSETFLMKPDSSKVDLVFTAPEFITNDEGTLVVTIWNDYEKIDVISSKIIIEDPQEIMLEETPSTIEITSVNDGDILSGKTNVLVEASDESGINNVSLLIDGKIKSLLFAEPYNFELDTNLFGNGEHEMKIIATDMGSSFTEKTISVFVENESSACGSFEFVYDGQCISAAIIVIPIATTVGIIVAILYRKMKN